MRDSYFVDGLLWSGLNTFLDLTLRVIKLSIKISEQNNNNNKKHCSVKHTASELFETYWSTISQNVDFQFWETVCEPWETVFQNYLLVKINLIYRVLKRIYGPERKKYKTYRHKIHL